MNDNFMFGNTGWICPRCGKVHAPFVPSCDCNESVSTTGTTGTSSNQSNKCPHSWQFTGQSTVGDHYTCEYCGATRTEYKCPCDNITASVTVSNVTSTNEITK